ncbi:UNVERIFIED_CONTAM: hypothetical protein GTU68_064287 [Idotea baltica]|nr:hypothetical protein [Idotea baltica]
MNDILPDKTPVWRYLEQVVARLLDCYGYRQIRLPIVESTELFKRSIGEVTDIVEKEMYTFLDRNGDSLTLRPEGTAVCVRSILEHNLCAQQSQKMWYMGPMFRHERPQKGRYRQFHQIGIEALNIVGPDIDAEIILLSWRLWCELGIQDAVQLELNTLGSTESRQRYKEALVDYLLPHVDLLDEDSQRRLTKNPLRILDSKNSFTQKLLSNAPTLDSYLDEESRQHFDGVRARLDAAGVEYTINSRLVRGLDYYSKTVFEWVTTHLGSQSAVCAGGRYDGLVEQLGGKATPSIGLAMGMERLILLLELLDKIPSSVTNRIDVYFCAMGESAEICAMSWAEKIRNQLPELNIQVNMGGGSFKSQLKKADKSGAIYALLIGENELDQQIISCKPLRNHEQQEEISFDNLINFLQNKLTVFSNKGVA